MAVRGQATTEAALGMLVITTVIVFGIHFSEVSILSLKVQEAGAAAIWDATAKRMSNLVTAGADFNPRQNAIDSTGTETATRYANFDGRRSKAGSGSTMVFTQAGSIDVTCVASQNLPVLDMADARGIDGIYNGGQSGMECWAESDFGLVPRFARNFMENRPFRVQHSQVDTMHICSMARAQNGGCNGHALVALGDWGFSDGMEAENCDLVAPNGVCDNHGFYQMTKAAYTAMAAQLNKDGDILSSWLYEGAYFNGPAFDVDENAFFMSAVGENWNSPRPYQKQAPNGEHQGFGPYTVTPGGPPGVPFDQVYQNPRLWTYPDAAQQRELCAFGLPCNASLWPAYQ